MTLNTIHGRKLALRVLDAGRLRDLVEAMQVSVTDRRSRDVMIQALADTRRVDLMALVTRLTRDELKAMCRALGLPDDGREKAVIVDRLMGPAGFAPDHADREAEAEAETRPTKPWRSQVLDLLRRDELIEGVDELELEVADRRVLQNLKDAIDRSPFSITRVLDNLPRARLKEICRVLGLDDGGREKAPIVERIAREAAGSNDDVDVEPPGEVPSKYGPQILPELLGPALSISDPNNYWPAKGALTVGGEHLPVDIHARVIGGTSRSPLERRFQNPASSAAINPTPGRRCLLLGIWVEHGLDRAVLVAFDAYRRRDKTTRTSLFMPLSLLEAAADTGFVSHETASGETIYAFRPDSLARYLDALHQSSSWAEQYSETTSSNVSAKKNGTTMRPLAPPTASDSVEIRPKSGMFAAFARLNYKPWFALAELVDNAVQSFLSNRERLASVGSAGPLIVDVQLEGDELSITDRAAGIRFEDFPRAFSPATPPADATGLSEFGLGMKAAACWFANEWSVRTSALGEPVERTVFFDVPRITEEGLDHLPIQTRDCRPEDHFTVLTMKKLRVRPKGSTLSKIKDHLASIYRLLIGQGLVRIRVTANGKSEELAYEQPRLLRAPFYLRPNDPPVLWRADLDVPLDDGRRVTGWAGIMEAGKHSRAGFAVFRRGRLIDGSVGEAYRHRAVFGAHNSFASQRLVGELYVEGFDVTHTKDGVQWGEEEDNIAYSIRMQLDTEELPMLEQANGYRARKSAAALPDSFGSSAIAATAAAAQRIELKADAPPAASPPEPDPPSGSGLLASGSATQEQHFEMRVAGDQVWDVHLELIRDVAAEWLHCGTVQKDGREHLQIRVNLDHPFSEEHLNDNERALEPVLRVAVAIALGEKQARMQGVANSGAVRRNANDLLRSGLCTAPLSTQPNEDR